jgi:hypothetical protein
MNKSRPTKYRPYMCDMAIELMQNGASHREVASRLMISRSTYYRWRRDKDDFHDAIEMGYIYSCAWWERQGRINLCNKNFNYRLWFINMRNRFGWSSRGKDYQRQMGVRRRVNVVTGISRAPDE